MKKFLLTAVFAVIGSWVFAQERIAVFPLEDMDKVFVRNEATMFYSQFTGELGNRLSGRYTIVPREDYERLINFEANFQLSNFSAREKTAEMNRVLNGTQILSVKIAKVSNNNAIQITVSLHKYPDLAVLPGGATLRVANTDELFSKIPELIQSMYNAITGQNSGTGATGATNKTYKIGDTGPAGGIVFFDRGFIADGWRYLEAAPAGTDFTAAWGAIVQNVAGTDRPIGYGKRNTQIIVDYLNRIGEYNRAAQICADMNVNGYTDWFLPSVDELELMYKNLKQKGLGGLNNRWYWSSSQERDSLVYAWIQHFDDGNQSTNMKAIEGPVRAIRAF